MLTGLIVSAVLLGGPTVSTPFDSRCSIVLTGAERRPSPVEYLRRTVRDADAVVHVRATALADSLPERQTFGPRTRLRFDVLDVLRGDGVPPSLVLPGRVTEQDEYNGGSVPYTSPRRSALSGACLSYYYRLGGEYLFLLTREDDGAFTPYWAPLQPVNEQVRGTDDPWVLWLRLQVTR